MSDFFYWVGLSMTDSATSRRLSQRIELLASKLCEALHPLTIKLPVALALLPVWKAIFKNTRNFCLVPSRYQSGTPHSHHPSEHTWATKKWTTFLLPETAHPTAKTGLDPCHPGWNYGNCRSLSTEGIALRTQPNLSDFSVSRKVPETQSIKEP